MEDGWMEKCKWCGVKTGYTHFIGVVDGRFESLCKACFFQHLNGVQDSFPREKIGSLSYEVLSKSFILDWFGGSNQNKQSNLPQYLVTPIQEQFKLASFFLSPITCVEQLRIKVIHWRFWQQQNRVLGFSKTFYKKKGFDAADGIRTRAIGFLHHLLYKPLIQLGFKGGCGRPMSWPLDHSRLSLLFFVFHEFACK